MPVILLIDTDYKIKEYPWELNIEDNYDIIQETWVIKTVNSTTHYLYNVYIDKKTKKKFFKVLWSKSQKREEKDILYSDNESENLHRISTFLKKNNEYKIIINWYVSLGDYNQSTTIQIKSIKTKKDKIQDDYESIANLILTSEHLYDFSEKMTRKVQKDLIKLWVNPNQIEIIYHGDSDPEICYPKWKPQPPTVKFKIEKK